MTIWSSNLLGEVLKMRKKDKEVYKEKINWKKEASLLPGYLIIGIWLLFTAAFLIWILGASLSTSKEIFSGAVFSFKSGFHFENYINAWNSGNVSVYFQIYIPWEQGDQNKPCPCNEYSGSYDHYADLFPDGAVSYQGKDPADHPVYSSPRAVYNHIPAEFLRKSVKEL